MPPVSRPPALAATVPRWLRGLVLIALAALVAGAGAIRAAETDTHATANANTNANTNANAGARPVAAGVARVVSLNPSLTAMAVALGAADRLVGIDDYSARLEPSIAGLPRVGGLHSPSLETVVALRPDVVVLVPSVAQRDFRERLAGLGIRVEVFENARFDEVLENIARMGALLAQPEAAGRRIAAIEAARARAVALGATRGAPTVALVLQREPLYVVGAGSFMAEMLAMLGAKNLGDAFEEPYPRVDTEWLVAAAPAIVIDMTDDTTPAIEYWSRFKSLPAVATGHVHGLAPGLVSLPGPDLDRALAALASVLYGEAAGRIVAGETAS